MERLETAGLVSREVDPEDTRSFRVALTPKGEAAARELEQQEVIFARRILERVPEERREAVASSFQELLLAVRGATEACCPGAYEHLMEGLPSDETVEAACACSSQPCTQETHVELEVSKKSG